MLITIMMIICIHKKDTLQIIVTNKRQSPNLRMPVESYKKLIYMHDEMFRGVASTYVSLE